MNKQALFTNAHRIARSIAAAVGNYMVAFKLALKEAWGEYRKGESAMTDHTIQHLLLPSTAKNGKYFLEAAPAAYQIGDTVTWSVHLNAEGYPVDPNARRRRRGVKPAVEMRTYTLTVDGTGKQFKNDADNMRQRFYGEITLTTKSI